MHLIITIYCFLYFNEFSCFAFSAVERTMVRGLLNLWKKWEIQILVLLSFTLQFVLLAFAGTRRRKGSALFRIHLWLAYMHG